VYLSGRIVVVTGAAGILGQAVARACMYSGAGLILLDRAPERLAALFPDLDGSPDHLLLTGIDAASETDAAEVVAQGLVRFGRIDALVATVGGWSGGEAVQNTSMSEWHSMLQVNLFSALAMCRAAIPAMLDAGSGSLVTVGSRSALAGAGGAAAYSAAKAAVLRMTESIAAELRGSGVRANCVLPGTIDTPQNREDQPDADHSRWVAPDAIADVVVFLCSDAARAVTGAAIPVYGQS